MMRPYPLLLAFVLLAGCSHSVPVAPVTSRTVVAAAPPASPLPVPVVMDGHPQYNPSAPLGTVWHPVPDGMLVDMDGTPCRYERSTCHPKGDMIDGRKWPHWATTSGSAFQRNDTTNLSPAERRQSARNAISAQYDDISAQREQLHEQETQIYTLMAPCSENSPCHINAENALYDLQQHDIGLSTRQAELQEDYKGQFVHYESADGSTEGNMP